jgi:hypothetical protein
MTNGVIKHSNHTKDQRKVLIIWLMPFQKCQIRLINIALQLVNWRWKKNSLFIFPKDTEFAVGIQ